MPSVQYGSTFYKNGLLITLWAGVVQVKSGVLLTIVWNRDVMLERNGIPYCKVEFKCGM